MTREYSPQPGANWQTVVRQVETVVPDDEQTRPNRAARRADARSKRKSRRISPRSETDAP